MHHPDSLRPFARAVIIPFCMDSCYTQPTGGMNVAIIQPGQPISGQQYAGQPVSYPQGQQQYAQQPQQYAQQPQQYVQVAQPVLRKDY